MTSIGYDVYRRPLVREVGPVIYLISDQSFTPGKLTGFNVWFTEPGPGTTSVRFQIWRPVASSSSSDQKFELVMEKVVYPIQGRFEVIVVYKIEIRSF